MYCFVPPACAAILETPSLSGFWCTSILSSEDLPHHMNNLCLNQTRLSLSILNLDLRHHHLKNTKITCKAQFIYI